MISSSFPHLGTPLWRDFCFFNSRGCKQFGMWKMPQILTSGLREPNNGVAVREGFDNYFTPARLIFALLVVLGHAFVIGLRDPSLEPNVFFHYTLSYMAVNLFFIASGFLVTKSMLYKGDSRSFLSARLLRIYPALIVHVLFVLLIIGPLATTMPWREFFAHPDVLKQPFLVLTFLNTEMVMPEAFSTNAEQLGSAPLWTLRFEVLCYFATLAAFSFGLMRHKWMVLAQFVLPSMLWVIVQTSGVMDDLPATAQNMLRFGIAYGLGATIYAYREKIRFNWAGLAFTLALCWIFQATSAIEISMNLMLAWIVMTIAYARMPKLRGLQKMDDISYGIYIYHWAILQLLFYWMPDLSVLELFAIGLPPTIAVAWLSWTFIEKPMLEYKTQFADWLRFGREPKVFDRRAVLLD